MTLHTRYTNKDFPSTQTKGAICKNPCNTWSVEIISRAECARMEQEEIMDELDDLRFRVFRDGNFVAEFAEERDARKWANSIVSDATDKAEVYDLENDEVVYTVYPEEDDEEEK